MERQRRQLDPKEMRWRTNMRWRSHGSKLGLRQSSRKGCRRNCGLPGSILTVRRAIVCGCLVDLVLLCASWSPRWIWGQGPAATQLLPKGSFIAPGLNERVHPPAQAMVRILRIGKVAWRVANKGDRPAEGLQQLRSDPAGSTHALNQTLAGLPGARVSAVDLSSE